MATPLSRFLHSSGGFIYRFAQTNVYENAEIARKWHRSCFCQEELSCLLAMFAYQQMTRTQIYNVMR